MRRASSRSSTPARCSTPPTSGPAARRARDVTPAASRAPSSPREGDTPQAIARRFGAQSRPGWAGELSAANPILSELGHIHSGLKLTVPDPWGRDGVRRERHRRLRRRPHRLRRRGHDAPRRPAGRGARDRDACHGGSPRSRRLLAGPDVGCLQVLGRSAKGCDPRCLPHPARDGLSGRCAQRRPPRDGHRRRRAGNPVARRAARRPRLRGNHQPGDNPPHAVRARGLQADTPGGRMASKASARATRSAPTRSAS